MHVKMTWRGEQRARRDGHGQAVQNMPLPVRVSHRSSKMPSDKRGGKGEERCATSVQGNERSRSVCSREKNISVLQNR